MLGQPVALTTSSTRELGDFQTPPELAAAVLRAIDFSGEDWPRVLEPSCGTGSFLTAATSVDQPPAEVVGIEIQECHALEAERSLAGARTSVAIEQADIFTYDLSGIPWRADGPLMVIGNPPWITLAELGALDSRNVPSRSNIRGVSGMAAMTGDSNFDIAEYIWMRLLVELRQENPTIILLCKTSVARRVLTLAHDLGLPVAESKLWRIDAKRHFGVSADACAFLVRLETSASDYMCDVFPDLDAARPESVMGVVGGRLVAQADAYEKVAQFDGRSPEVWRSGVKHDLSAVMELKVQDGELRNGLDEIVDVEHEYVLPLLKSSDLNAGRSADERRVLVTQRNLQENTERLRDEAPRLWRYLSDHSDRFAARRSSVYRGRSSFAMFGIGEYTFAPYKIAISGLYKTPQFRLLRPVDGHPVVVDDTCYYLPFSSLPEAVVAHALLRSPPAQKLLTSLFFPDAKRPITKKLLSRLNLGALIEAVDEQEVASLAGALPDVESGELEKAYMNLRSRWVGDPQLAQT